MDQHVEKQCLEQLQAGDLGKFNLLVEEYFEDVYKYVFRRVMDSEAAEKLVMNIFADGLSQAKEANFDVEFKVWIFAVAKTWVWRYVDHNGFPTNQGVNAKPEFVGTANNDMMLADFAKMMAKLSLQEKEMVRLKFFEELSDFDVAYVLGEDASTIAQKVLRVIKRVHLLLFGINDDSSMYFAQVSGELSKIRAMELIEVNESFRLDVKADVARRVNANDFAIDVEAETEKVDYSNATGSDDPAKIFVEAVREMREEQAAEHADELMRMERMEGFFARFGGILVSLFVLIFIVLMGVSAYTYYVDNLRFIVRGYPTICEDVDFDKGFNDTERRYINSGISDEMCAMFDVEEIDVTRISRSEVNFEVETAEDFRHYTFVQDKDNWFVKKYEKNIDRD